ncbi:hypothetical protein MTR67_052130, partial [Solanum verrucosum]
FITGLPHTRRQHGSIWVKFDRVTKCVHFLFVKTTNSAEGYSRLYINEIIRFHGVLLSIISYRGPQFTSYFSKPFQKSHGTQLNLSTIFHPQTDGYHSNIQMALYKALYGRRCRSPVGWFEVGETTLIGPDLVHDAMEKVHLIKDTLKTT